MPPHNKLHLSDSDRFSSGDFSVEDDDDDMIASPYVSPFASPQSRRRAHSNGNNASDKHRAPTHHNGGVASKSTRRAHRQLASGFSDWRASSGGGGGGGAEQDGGNKDGSSSQPPAVGRRRQRRYQQIHSSSLNDGSNASSFTSSSSSASPSDVKQDVKSSSSSRKSGGPSSSSSDKLPFKKGGGPDYGNTKDGRGRNIRDMESDVLARPQEPPKRRHHGRSNSRAGKNSSSSSGVLARRISADTETTTGEDASLVPSLPSLITEDTTASVISCATERTNKFSNTTMATMSKYKQLYEAMLEDAVMESGGKDGTAWEGLGDDDKGSKTEESKVRRALADAARVHNSSIANKSAFHVSSSFGSNSSSSGSERSIGQDRDRRHDSQRAVVAKKASFHSQGGSRQGSSTLLCIDEENRDKDKVMIPCTPNCTVLADETIDGLQVEELLLEDNVDVDNSPDVALDDHRHGEDRTAVVSTDPAADYDENCLVNNDRQIVPTGRKKKRAGGEDPQAEVVHRSSNMHSSVASGGMDLEKTTSLHSGILAAIDAGSELKPTKKPSFHKNENDEKRHRHQNNEKRHHHNHHRSRRKARKSQSPSRKKSRSPSTDKRQSSSRRDRSSSRGPSSDASVGSQRSSRSNRSTQSNSSRRRGLSRSRSGSRRRQNDTEGDDDVSNQPTSSISTNEAENAKPKKGLFRKIKKLAGKVLGISSVHKYGLGERARYRVGRVPKRGSRNAEGYDAETASLEVEIMALHIDAVLDMPYYTIRLPDGSRKQTNWDNLMPLPEYRKIKNAGNNGIIQGDGDDDDGRRSAGKQSSSGSRRLRSLSRSRSARSLSRSRHDGPRERSTSQQPGGEESRRRRQHRRGSSRGPRCEDDDDKSTSSRRSTKSTSSRRSSRSASSRQSYG